MQLRRVTAAVLSVLMLLASASYTPVSAASSGFTGPYAMENWSASGPGTVTISPSSGSTTTAEFSYSYTSPGIFNTLGWKIWKYEMTAPATGTLTFDWTYSGIQGGPGPLGAYVIMDAFTNGPGGGTLLVPTQLAYGGFNFSGTATLHVTKGDTFGIEVGGYQTYNSSRLLQGIVTLTNFNAPPVDTTPPVITLTTPGSSVASTGWYNRASSGSAGLTVEASAVDDATGVTNLTCTDAGTQVLNTSAASGTFVLPDGIHSVTCTATDGAGNTGAAAGSTSMPATYQVDQTPPSIAFTGNAGTYQVDQSVEIACSATDQTSGIDAALTNCPNTSGPAYAFNLGMNTVNASATDNAGNASSASTTFTVADTCPGLEGLAGQFVTNSGAASSFERQVAAICSAPNAKAKAGTLGAFVHHVNAQSGKQLTSAQAAVLIRLADAL